MDVWVALSQYATVETERMILRPFSFVDSDDFFEISSNRENLPFIFPYQASQEESDFLLVHYFMKNPLGIWAIEDKSSGRMIGAIRFEHLNVSDRTAEIGYFLHRDFWGRGIMTECLKTVTFLAFHSFYLKKLSIIVHKENLASQRVAKKAGYVFKRCFKGSDRYNRKMRDYVEYGLKAKEYRYE